MTDHNTDIGFPRSQSMVDIDELISGSSLGTAAARDIQNRISDARASRINSALSAAWDSCKQAAADMELDYSLSMVFGPSQHTDQS
ncbi:hypothetical protein [Nocardia sp. NPDC020380]|uniref:hypothetical protein n=1 Tax=Nocardia sp. NPDC020380 TaxID=3364309 RepID=UPI0037B68C9A